MSLQGTTISDDGPESTAELRERVNYLAFINKALEDRLQEQQTKNKDLDRQLLDLTYAKDQLARKLQETTPVPKDTNSADVASLKAQLAEASEEILKQRLLIGDAYMEAILAMNNQSAIKEEAIDKIAKSLPRVAAEEWMGHWEAAKRRHEEDPTADDDATKSTSEPPVASAGSGQKTTQQAQVHSKKQAEELLPKASSQAAPSEPKRWADAVKLSNQKKAEPRPQAPMAPEDWLMPPTRDPDVVKASTRSQADATPQPKQSRNASQNSPKSSSMQQGRGGAKGRETPLERDANTPRDASSGSKQKHKPETESVSDPKPRETQSEAARRIAGDVPKTQPSSQEGKGNVRDQTLSVTKTAAPPSKYRFILEKPQPPPSQQSLDPFGHFSVAKKGAGKKAAPSSKGGGAKTKTKKTRSEEVSNAQQTQVPASQSTPKDNAAATDMTPDSHESSGQREVRPKDQPPADLPVEKSKVDDSKAVGEKLVTAEKITEAEKQPGEAKETTKADSTPSTSLIKNQETIQGPQSKITSASDVKPQQDETSTENIQKGRKLIVQKHSADDSARPLRDAPVPVEKAWGAPPQSKNYPTPAIPIIPERKAPEDSAVDDKTVVATPSDQAKGRPVSDHGNPEKQVGPTTEIQEPAKPAVGTQLANSKPQLPPISSLLALTGGSDKVPPPEHVDDASSFEDSDEEDKAPAATSVRKDEGQDQRASSPIDTPRMESWADDVEDAGPTRSPIPAMSYGRSQISNDQISRPSGNSLGRGYPQTEKARRMEGPWRRGG